MVIPAATLTQVLANEKYEYPDIHDVARVKVLEYKTSGAEQVACPVVHNVGIELESL